MEIIKNEDISNGLLKSKRVYLCGNLKKDNELSHIKTDSYEMGITDYPEFTFEKAHKHLFNKEFNYVISGSVKVLLIAEKKEYEFRKGDLFMIDVNEPYVGKQLPGTRVLFTKVPGGDDKELVDIDDKIKAWGKSWDAKIKEDDNE